MEEPKDPATDHLYQLYSLVATDVQREEMAALYRRGGFGYGEVKKALADAAEKYFAEPRAKRGNLPPIRSGFAKFWPTAPAVPGKKLSKSWPAPKKLAELKDEFVSTSIELSKNSVLPMSRSVAMCLWVAIIVAIAVALARIAVWLQMDHFAAVGVFPVLSGAACGVAVAWIGKQLAICGRTKIILAAIFAAIVIVSAEHLLFYLDYCSQFAAALQANPKAQLAATLVANESSQSRSIALCRSKHRTNGPCGSPTL